MTWRPRAGAGLVLALCASFASSCNGKTHAPAVTRVAAYIATDACSAHLDSTSCDADTTNGCAWDAITIDCPAGSTCPTGFCHGTSPCDVHTDATSCGADTANACAWADVSAALAPCPSGATCTTSTGC